MVCYYTIGMDLLAERPAMLETHLETRGRMERTVLERRATPQEGGARVSGQGAAASTRGHARGCLRAATA